MMVTAQKRFSSTSPRKAQAKITSFTSKQVDYKSSLRRSYAQAVLENPYECLSGNEDEDEIMYEEESCNSSEATPKIDNAQVSQSPNSENVEDSQPPRSKKCKGN